MEIASLLAKAAWKFKFPLLLLLFGVTVWFGYKHIAKISLDLRETTVMMEQYRDESERMSKEMYVREQVRLAREDESNKRWTALQRRLDNAEAKLWAATPLPSSLRGLSVALQTMPNESTGSPANQTPNSGR